MPATGWGNVADLLTSKSVLTVAGIDYVAVNEFGGVFAAGLDGTLDILVRSSGIEPAVVGSGELLLADRGNL